MLTLSKRATVPPSGALSSFSMPAPPLLKFCPWSVTTRGVKAGAGGAPFTAVMAPVRVKPTTLSLTVYQVFRLMG
jgi:hypothetical protein